MELYKIYVVKEDGRKYVDIYLVWYFQKVRYERINPTFKGFSQTVLLARAVKAENVQDMKAKFLDKMNSCSEI